MGYLFEVSYIVSLIVAIVFFMLAVMKKIFWVLPLVVIFIFAQLYLFFRLRKFIKTLKIMIEELSQGEFNVDPSGSGTDFMAKILLQMASALKKTGDFEKLRQGRVLLYYRALSLILRRIDKPVVWIDVEKDVFRLNPSCQKLFGVEQDEYKLSGILSLADNDVFASWLRKLINNSDIVPDEIACEVALPVSKRPHMLYVNSLVVKTGEEKAQIIFLFLRQA